MSKQQDADSDSGENNHDESDEQRRHETHTLSARRRPRWWTVALALSFVGLIAAGLFVPTSYTTFGPGSLWPTEQEIEVEGQQAYDSAGEIRFVTVSVKRASAFELVRAYLDDTIDIRDFEESYPTGDPKAERVINLKKMDDAKLTALLVAFDELGLPATLTGTGAFIEAVVESMPAFGKLEQGEVIVGVDSKEIATQDDLTDALAEKTPGDAVSLTVRGVDDKTRQVDVVLAAAPNSEPDDGHPDSETEGDEIDANKDGGDESESKRGLLGISVTTADQDLEIPFDIELDSGDVTGPSAGLAWTLGVIDRLSPEDLTNGKLVAATGTIRADGSVGTIGGIAQKVKAAISGHADVFLYPDDTDPADVARMTEIADGHLELQPVDSVDEALDFLLDGESLAPVMIE